MDQHQAQQLQFILPLLIIVPILFFRLRKMSRPQPLKLGRLWIRPAIILVAAAVALMAPQRGAAMPFNAAEWIGLALAGVLGVVAGWYWGRTMHIAVHPENGTLMARGNAAGMIVLVALIAVRLGLRPLLTAEGPALHLNVLLATDALIVFSAALFTARSAEMWLRARKVMGDAPAP